MQIEKKQILKEDGRYLVFYHFPASASEEQTTSYAQIPAAEPDAANHPENSAATQPPGNEEQSRV